MRLVVDSNMLKEEALHHFLTASSSNAVVLTDYLMMEAYKAGDVKSFLELMHTLCSFRRQVHILKPTGIVSILKGRPSGLTRRMIEPGSDQMMSAFCSTIDKTVDHKLLEKSFIRSQTAAGEHMGVLLENAKHMIASANEVVSYFSKPEMEQFRTLRKMSRELAFKTMELIKELAYNMLEGANYPGRVRPVELVNLYAFRFALCGVLLVIRWIRTGNNPLGKPDRVRNDLVDMSFCTYATYFDGPLTNDRAMQEMYNEARVILGLLGASVGR